MLPHQRRVFVSAGRIARRTAASYATVNTVPSLLVLSDVRQEIARYRLRIDRHVMNTDAAKMTELEKSIKEAADNTEKLFKKYEGVISDDKDKALLQKVRDAFASYMKDADLVLVEGAGSPAEINLRAGDIATRNPKTIPSSEKLIVAEREMTRNKITSLLVTDEGGKLAGVIQIYDIKL